MQPLQRRQVGEFFAGYPVDGACCRARGGGVDDDDLCRPAHLERHIHTRGTTVDELGSVGHAAFPEMAHQDRSDAVVAAQQIATPDDQHLATRLIGVRRGIAGVGSSRCRGQVTPSR